MKSEEFGMTRWPVRFGSDHSVGDGGKEWVGGLVWEKGGEGMRRGSSIFLQARDD